MSARISWLLLALLALDNCVSTSAPLEYLDNDSAATITVAARGFVFARERPDLAAHAQDYVTVTPVQVNRNGQRTLYLYCQIWSTIDRRTDKAIVPANAELALIADDRRFALPGVATDIQRLGFGRAPVEPPVSSAEVRAGAIDRETLHFIVGANQVRVGATAAGVTEYFNLWRDGRSTANTFLRKIDETTR